MGCLRDARDAARCRIYESRSGILPLCSVDANVSASFTAKLQGTAPCACRSLPDDTRQPAPGTGVTEWDASETLVMRQDAASTKVEAASCRFAVWTQTSRPASKPNEMELRHTCRQAHWLSDRVLRSTRHCCQANSLTYRRFS